MIWKNEGLLSGGESAGALVYPRELHVLGRDALVAIDPNAAQLAPDRRFESLHELTSRVERGSVLPVRALVFHSSRCGSTLLARLFAAEGSTRVFAEPPVLGRFLWRFAEQLGRGEMQRELAAFVRAFGLAPTPNELGVVIKLPSWALLFLEPLRACFPNTPFAYLLRDPIQVVASIRDYQPIFLGRSNRPRLAAAFGGDPATASRMDVVEWYAWYIDRNLRLALKHERVFTAVIDHARLAEQSVRWVNAVTSAHLEPSRADIAQLLGRHAKSPDKAYRSPAAADVANFETIVTNAAGEAYRLWQQRLTGSTGVEPRRDH